MPLLSSLALLFASSSAVSLSFVIPHYYGTMTAGCALGLLRCVICALHECCSSCKNCKGLIDLLLCVSNVNKLDGLRSQTVISVYPNNPLRSSRNFVAYSTVRLIYRPVCSFPQI